MNRIFTTLVLLCLFASPYALAVECSAIFPGNQPFAGSGSIDNSTRCNGAGCGFESFTSTSIPLNTNLGNILGYASGVGVFGDQAYNYYDEFSQVEGYRALTNGSSTVIYLSGSGGSKGDFTIKKNAQLNIPLAGSRKPGDFLLVVNGDLKVEEGASISGFIYVDGDVVLEKDIIMQGAISATGSFDIKEDGTYNYDPAQLSGLDSHGFCEPPPPVTCDVADSYTAVTRTDNFNTREPYWRSNNFSRSISNWPGETIYNSNGENQSIIWDINGDLSVQGSVSSGGDNEYGMVEYDVRSDGIDSTNANQYAIYTYVETNDNQSTNNDMGIVFGYQDDSNYYLARWTAFGTAYSGNSVFPGTHRQLDLIQVSGGVATTLDSSVEQLGDRMTLMVVANDEGVGVCTGGSTTNPRDMDLKIFSAGAVDLHDFGMYSYDNDVGIHFDNLDFRCEDCVPISIEPLAFYQFEQETFSPTIQDSTSNNNFAINDNGIKTDDGKYCRAFDSNGTNSSNTINNAFISSLDLDNDVGTQGSIGFWFNSNIDWNNGPERVLFDASCNRAKRCRSDKYFTLEIRSDGRLKFSFEDSNDSDFSFSEPSGTVRQANTWYYITTTWDYIDDEFNIFVDGSLVASSNANTNGRMRDLTNIHFGDNSSTYTSGGNSTLASYHSANGKFDNVKIYGTPIPTSQIIADMDGTDCQSSTTYLIEHDGSGLTCQSEPVTIRACADASCTSFDTSANANVDFIASGATQSVSIVNGVGTTSFNYRDTTTPAELSLATDYQCLNTVSNNQGSGGAACQVQFASTGFVFSNIGNQVSGIPYSGITIQAVADDGGVCTALVNDTTTIDMALEYQTPNAIPTDSGGTPYNARYSIDGTVILGNAGAITNYSPISLAFNGAGTATLSNNRYDDAGQIRLHARYVIPASGSEPEVRVEGMSNLFWVRPEEFLVTSSLPAGIFPAGDTFDFTVTAVNALDQQTYNYLQNDVEMQVTRTAPTATGSVDGLFTYQNGLTPILAQIGAGFTDAGAIFNLGQFTSSSAQYSEVGNISVDVRENNYGNQGLVVNGNAISLGRFTPKYFTQVVSNHGALSGQCGNWAYSGQQLSTLATDTINILSQGAIGYTTQPIIEISARNTQGAVTQNYRDFGSEDFMKLDELTIPVTIPAPTEDIKNGSLGAGNPILLNGTINANNNLAQVTSGGTVQGGVHEYTLSLSDHFTYTKNQNAVLPPFAAEFDLDITLIEDADGVQDGVNAGIDSNALTAITFRDDAAIPLQNTLTIRFGRLVLENSYGPETALLAQPFYTEFLGATNSYVRNTEDNCTLISKDPLYWQFTNPTGAISVGDISIPAPSISGALVAGEHRNVSLRSNDNQGTIDVEFVTPAWLQFDWSGDNDGLFDENANAVATFGQYRGNDRIIYWRELNQ